MFFLHSCEQSEIKSFGPIDQDPISYRGPCDLCQGIDECCCYIELGNDNSASLQICGASQPGGTACTGSSACGSSPSGGGFSFTLTTGNPRFPLCMLEGNPLWIQNVSLSDKADIYFTCLSGTPTPQLVHIQLNPGQRAYFETDNICIISGC